MSFLFFTKNGGNSKKGQKSPKNARKTEKSFLARRGYPKSFLRLGATLPKSKIECQKTLSTWRGGIQRGEFEWASALEKVEKISSHFDLPVDIWTAWVILSDFWQEIGLFSYFNQSGLGGGTFR